MDDIIDIDDDIDINFNLIEEYDIFDLYQGSEQDEDYFLLIIGNIKYIINTYQEEGYEYEPDINRITFFGWDSDIRFNLKTKKITEKYNR